MIRATQVAFTLAALAILLTLALTGCDFARMPPCSALIAIGTITINCPPPIGSTP